ncbi:DUF2971 domain-containing protein [Microbacterium oxydans]|uniref:DUF2971 domain-containing protein n=1 Tax=Microbacterium oxydans TaxID=82380 RepID=UPI0022B2001D|nr:DUF2971 domain-containing protein [Microbacterium oxydans]MCZ4302202.1 DUF2971 domain-containing protein [Microbacterium oxydans]
MAGFYGIVSNHELWASSATMLNDASEMSFGVARVREAYVRWRPAETAHAAANRVIHDAIDSLETMMSTTPPFVLSASTSPELLNQWANYGESSGCAVGLASMTLLIAEGKAGKLRPTNALPLWHKVIYKSAAQETHIRRILDQMVDPEGMIARATAEEAYVGAGVLAMQNLAMLAATLKHPGFQAEREVRFLAFREEETRVHFRPTPRGIVPYVKLFGTEMDETEGVQYSTSLDDKIRLPIVGARVGPPQGESEQRRAAAMHEFLHAHDYDVEVQGAGIPYLP